MTVSIDSCIPNRFSAHISLYGERKFTVLDSGVESVNHSQKAGISQGCPLSPFLFGMVMTVLMTDAREMLTSEAKRASERGELEDILFCRRHIADKQQWAEY